VKNHKPYVVAPTFTQWVRLQRDGPFAALAHYVAIDSAWPTRARQLVTFVRHVAGKPAAPSERTIRTAFVAFEAAARRGIPSQLYRRRVPVRRITRSYTVEQRTHEQLETVAAQLGVDTRGAAIDALVARFLVPNVTDDGKEQPE